MRNILMLFIVLCSLSVFSAGTTLVDELVVNDGIQIGPTITGAKARLSTDGTTLTFRTVDGIDIAISDDSGLTEIQDRTNFWNTAYSWGDWGPRVGTLDAGTNFWNTAYSWGDWQFSVGELYNYLNAYTNTYSVRLDDTFTIERSDGFVEGSYTNALVYNMRIEIPLNPGGYPGTWTDYEFKILFVTNSVEVWTTNTLVYYYQTMGDPWDGTDNYQEIFGDRDARVYYVDDYNASDVRKWMLYQNVTEGVIDIQSLALQFISSNTVVETVLHFPSHDGCSVPWETWQWKQNEHNLRAVFVRYNSLGPEMNHDGTLQKWNPVAIDWVPKRKSE